MLHIYSSILHLHFYLRNSHIIFSELFEKNKSTAVPTFRVLYIRVQKTGWNEVFFQDSEETIPISEINNTSYESQADFHWEKT